MYARLKELYSLLFLKVPCKHTLTTVILDICCVNRNKLEQWHNKWHAKIWALKSCRPFNYFNADNGIYKVSIKSISFVKQGLGYSVHELHSQNHLEAFYSGGIVQAMMSHCHEDYRVASLMDPAGFCEAFRVKSQCLLWEQFSEECHVF